MYMCYAGDKQVTMNVHLLSHVTNCVRNWGPLWCYSCFQFESMNKEVKKLFRGTQCRLYDDFEHTCTCIDGLLVCDAASTTSCYIPDACYSSGTWCTARLGVILFENRYLCIGG